jgi:hypothetical protein
MPCNMPGFHGGDYEECRLLGCGAMRVMLEPAPHLTSQNTVFLQRLLSRKLRLTTVGVRRADHTTHLFPQMLALNFADKWLSLSRCRSLPD